MLHEVLKSIELQTYGNYEVLVLDNASPEDAREILRSFAENDARVRILRTDQRIPMFTNFNRGIRAASGEYVVFFHDDDIYLPNFIVKQLDMLQKNPSAGFVGSNYHLIDEAGHVIRRRELIVRTEVVSGRRFISSLVKRGRNIMPTPGIMYRRSVLESYGFDENLPIHWGDFVLLMRMAETCDVALIAEPLVHIRMHSDQGTSSIPLSEQIPLRTDVMRNYCTEYAMRRPDDKAFVRSLERQLSRSHRVGLLWGWMLAPGESEAAACLRELSKAQGNAKLVSILRRTSRLGLSPGRRRAFFAPLLRKLGTAVGV